jgi:ubiquinone/menaquinone biosynthesis C-methylase UbiE
MAARSSRKPAASLPSCGVCRGVGSCVRVSLLKTSVAPDDAAYAGQAIYTPRMLSVYDVVVLRFNAYVMWRCSPRRLVALYDEHISNRHLDIGVGTGFLVDKCRFPRGSLEITLMDLNPNPLRYAAKRLGRYQPKTHLANALEPFDLPAGSFDSIGLNWLLHCLPGDIASKSVVFEHCRTVIAPGGVIFGSTVLNSGVTHTPWSRLLMRKLNREGIFSNLADDLEGLRDQLGKRFDRFHVEVVGTVALFSARV